MSRLFIYLAILLNQMFSMKKRLNRLLKIHGRAWMKSHLHLNQKSSRMKISLSLPHLTRISDNLCHVQKHFMLWSNENFSLHFRHIYSYIGISDSFKVSIVINYFISQYAVKSINTILSDLHLPLLEIIPAGIYMGVYRKTKPDII